MTTFRSRLGKRKGCRLIHIFVLVGVVVFGIHERTGCEIEESKQIRFHRRKFRWLQLRSLAKAPPLS